MKGDTRPALYPGEVVQINPEADPKFGGCFLVVQAVRSWGVEGYIPLIVEVVYFRAAWEKIELVGPARWWTKL